MKIKAFFYPDIQLPSSQFFQFNFVFVPFGN